MAKKKMTNESDSNQTVKEKKPFYKRWWFIALVVLFIIAAIGGGDDETTDVAEDETETVEEVNSETESAEEVVEEEPEEVEIEEVVEEEAVEESEPVEIEEPEVTFDPNDYNADVTYDDLARNPDNHLFEAVTFEGKIIQVIQGEDSWQYRIATNDNYDKVMLIEIDSELLQSRILEDDYIRFYGTYMGEITYESALGGNITIPGVLVNHFEFK